MKRDFEEFLVKVQKQYTDMNRTIEKVNKQLADGLLDESAIEGITKYYDLVSANYERLMYCRYLYNLPPKFIQKLQKKKLEREAKKFIEQHSDQDSIVAENQEGLDIIKDLANIDKEGETE